jgi:hypothetical protein
MRICMSLLFTLFLGLAGQRSVAQFVSDTLNPAAPPQLAAFSFLIGHWTGHVNAHQVDGTPINLVAEWSGHYMLDGYAIADHFSMRDTTGQLVMDGMNIRSFNSQTGAWTMRWLEALTSTCLVLGPSELGGVEIRPGSITYKIQYTGAEIHRITYSNITTAHFDWIADISRDNGRTWDEGVMTISADRK